MRVRAFTLIEMAIVMAIIAILSLLAIPYFQSLMIKNDQRLFLAEMATGQIAWLDAIQFGEKVHSAVSLKERWPYVNNAPQAVIIDLIPTTNTIRITDQRDNNQSRRCHQFSMNRYGQVEILAKDHSIVTLSCP